MSRVEQEEITGKGGQFLSFKEKKKCRERERNRETERSCQV